MWIYVWDSEIKGIYLWDTPVKEVYLWDTKIRPTKLPWLCFIAEQANSTVKLNKVWSPTSVSIETSTDWSSWTDYSFWTTITLSSLGDKVYFRNKSETATWFSTNQNSNYYQFVMWGLISASWDVNFLLCKNGVSNMWSAKFCNLFKSCTSLISAPELSSSSISNYWYYQMFDWCRNLVTAPSIPATSLNGYDCYRMFRNCSSLVQIPALYAKSMRSYCYWSMFNGCSKIKLSNSQTWDYTQPYRIPVSWTWETASYWDTGTFQSTWWTFTSDPSINTTYYVHKDNTIV